MSLIKASTEGLQWASDWSTGTTPVSDPMFALALSSSLHHLMFVRWWEVVLGCSLSLSHCSLPLLNDQGLSHCRAEQGSDFS